MRAFFKFQTSSVVSTLCDYSITLLLTEILSVLYVISSGIGLVCGGVINFTINKNWVFNRKGEKAFRLTALYALVWAANLLMNTVGLYVLTEFVGFDYRLSKVIASITVGVLLSYYAQKKFVFRLS